MEIGNGSLNHPEGIAVDSSSGNVYVADTANNRIQVFSRMVLSLQSGENTEDELATVH